MIFCILDFYRLSDLGCPDFVGTNDFGCCIPCFSVMLTTGRCFRGIYNGSLWEDDFYVSAPMPTELM